MWSRNNVCDAMIAWPTDLSNGIGEYLQLMYCTNRLNPTCRTYSLWPLWSCPRIKDSKTRNLHYTSITTTSQTTSQTMFSYPLQRQGPQSKWSVREHPQISAYGHRNHNPIGWFLSITWGPILTLQGIATASNTTLIALFRILSSLATLLVGSFRIASFISFSKTI